MSDWLSLSEAAELLGVHPSTVRMWADQGRLTAHRTSGGHRRFKRADVDAWAETRRESRPVPGAEQLVIETALGRARMQTAEGRLTQAAWYTHMDEHHKHAFREAGRRLLKLLQRYLADDAEVLAEAKVLGRAYEQLGRASGLSLTEKVESFLYFRDFLYDSVLDTFQASGQRAPREWAQMHRRIAAFTNVVLLALVVTHEQQEGA